MKWSNVLVWLRWAAAAAVGAVLALVASAFARRQAPDRARGAAAERDNEIVMDTLNELHERATIAAQKADRAGGIAAQSQAAAVDAPKRLREMSREQRRLALIRVGERLRAGAKVVILVALVLAPVHARADETLAHPRTGVEGWWMTDGEHLQLEEWATELVERRDQAAALQVQVGALRVADGSNAAAFGLCESSLAAASGLLTAADARAESLSAWYRSPRLWGALGLFVGAGLVTALALAVN